MLSGVLQRGPAKREHCREDVLGVRVDRIITLANKSVELQISVFLRSLRKVGCELPVWVIPFREKDFDLPPGCYWIEDSKLLRFLNETGAHPLYNKYCALLQSNCAYFDTDIILLREPRKWLESAPSHTFTVADTEWAKNRWTFSPDSLRFLATLSSCWQLFTFNTGFFVFEKPLYEEEELLEVIRSPEYRGTCLERRKPPIDQPAINWLVLRKRAKIFNFNLPEQYMESTMAVDYGTSSPEAIVSRPAAPAFLHFAGPIFQENLPVVNLFTSFLTAPERARWDAQVNERRRAVRWLEKWPLMIRVCNQLIELIDRRFHIQPKG
jgi:hypothetical protein